ncbi:MAG: S24 family peptidase [Gammaproteobacteria bacterium]|nr:S24 family peptidase [Gammaproteobacteria bacterium]MDH5800998.1 S24 family peptidase [Gammaproteobacteria bacterium]
MALPGCSDTTEPFALRVVGDSMLPEFHDGHIIIVDPSHPLCDGAYAVLEYEGEVLFGLYSRQNSQHTLRHLNSSDAPVSLNGPFEVKGVVVQRSTGRRRDLKHYEYEP